MTYRHHCARSLVCLRENERERVTKKTRGRESEDESDESGIVESRHNGRRGNDTDWENARLGEDARWRGKGSSLGRRVNGDGRGREG